MSGPYDVIVMDPPWPERGGGKIKRGADRHYPLVPMSEMPHVIMRAPCWHVADNALLWMWATETFLEDALQLIPRLGFRKCAGFVWAKIAERGTLDDGSQLFTPTTKLGLGQWSRVEHEHLLLARRGGIEVDSRGPCVPPPEYRSRSVVYAARGRHSAKPEAAWRLIETTSGAAFRYGRVLRRLEMFARLPREGWDAWGNEAPDAPKASPSRA